MFVRAWVLALAGLALLRIDGAFGDEAGQGAAMIPVAAPVVPPPDAAAVAKPIVIVVFGDSQADGLAEGMRHLLAGRKDYKVVNRARPGSALSQPLDYDWPAAVDKFVAADTADVAIMMFGGNDRLPTRIADGKPLPFRGDAWVTAYEEREKKIVNALTGAGMHVVWCGDPIASESHYSADMEWLNERFQEALPAGNAEYLSLWTVVADDDGHYTPYGKALDGETRRLRGVDGIHFTGEGYQVVASRVFSAIEAWKAASAPAATARAN
jgi:hypothetical protein